MIQAVEERTLETLTNTLIKTLPQIERDTILDSGQLTTERRTNPELRGQWLYTADSSLSTVEYDEAIWYLGRGPTNPIFKNIKEAARQFKKYGNYIPPKEDVEAVKSADTTLRVRLSDLKLQRIDRFYYFEIDTAYYNELNPEQRRVAEQGYAQGDDFVQNMEMLNKAGIKKTRVCVPNPDYVM